MLRAKLIKLLARMNFNLGLVFNKQTPSYEFSMVKSVLVNRADRIGDAAVSLPVLLELNKYFAVTALSSETNDFFLKKFIPTLKADEIIPGGGLKGIKPYDLFLNLRGARGLGELIRVRKLRLCKYAVGFNSGIGNLFLDYFEPSYPVLFSQNNIIDSYKLLIQHSLGVKLDVPDFMDLSDKMIAPKNFVLGEKLILINISGADKYRGPSLKAYADIVQSLDFDGKIAVMDELGRPNMDKFKPLIKKDNVIFLERDLTLGELIFIAKNSLLYIGSDSGVTNLLQISTNAVIFFSTGLPAVWRPFSLNPYVSSFKSGLVFEETRNSLGLRKLIIYALSSCRPCFDQGCIRPQCINRLQSQDVIAKIAQYLPSKGLT